mmetsp:Transcript_13877/g.39286  ORF Transcript_13877/g.39286 Transcript_13877/m.39286 type:complete len:369 (-) Transcript_13877:560-1666(-)
MKEEAIHCLRGPPRRRRFAGGLLLLLSFFCTPQVTENAPTSAAIRQTGTAARRSSGQKPRSTHRFKAIKNAGDAAGLVNGLLDLGVQKDEQQVSQGGANGRRSQLLSRRAGSRTIIFAKKTRKTSGDAGSPKNEETTPAVSSPSKPEAKMPKVRITDERKLSRSVGKLHELSTGLEQLCNKTKLSTKGSLGTIEGLHLLYPETWRPIDFVYHQGYGSSGQVRIPVLMNPHVDGLLKETFHTLVGEADLRSRLNTTSCAIVQKNLDIARLGFGDAIDGHSAVFRFGEFPLKEDITSYADMGVKTTFRVIPAQGLQRLFDIGENHKFHNLLTLVRIPCPPPTPGRGFVNPFSLTNLVQVLSCVFSCLPLN